MNGDEEKTSAGGCDGYFAQCIDTRSLPSAIEGCLGRWSGESANTGELTIVAQVIPREAEPK